MISLAVPVPGPDGVLYGLNVSVPAQRMSASMRGRIVAAPLEARSDLTSQLA